MRGSMLAAGLAAVLFAAPGAAALRVTYTGDLFVTHYGYDDSPKIIRGAFAYRAEFVFDTAGNPGGARLYLNGNRVRVYRPFSDPSFPVPGATFGASAGRIGNNVFSGTPEDFIDAVVDSPAPFGGGWPSQLAGLDYTVQPGDHSSIFFNSGTYSFEYYTHQIVYGYNSGIGTVDRVVTANVPEPATWALFVTGFGLAGGAVRRRRVAG